ncbi:MAG: metallophosphoesterase family protein [Armatimonadota bacterium]
MDKYLNILLITVALITTSSAAMADFTFVQISDTHTGSAETAFNARFDEAIKQANNLNPAFVIHTGDALQGWSIESIELFKDYAKKISSPVYIAPGNHDIPELVKSGEKKGHALLNSWRKAVGYDRISFTHGNCAFISLNSNLWNTGYLAEREQFDWLTSELDKAKGKRIFIFQHSPIYLSNPNEKNGNYFATDNPARGKLLDLFASHHVEAVITGHYHRMNNTVYKGISFLTSPAISFSCDPDQGLTGYTVFNVYPGGFSHRFIDFRKTGIPPDFIEKR